MIDLPEYTRLRNHILHFLVQGSQSLQEHSDRALALNGAKPSVVSSIPASPSTPPQSVGGGLDTTEA
jgi:hypothetical protein